MLEMTMQLRVTQQQNKQVHAWVLLCSNTQRHEKGRPAALLTQERGTKPSTSFNYFQHFAVFLHFPYFFFFFFFLNKLILENIRFTRKVQIQYREFPCTFHLVCPNINALHKIIMIHLSKLGNESWCITVN